MTLSGPALIKNSVLIAANSTYEDVIEETINAGFTPNAFTYEGTATWKGYQFYPAGKTISINNLMRLFTILKQKFLLSACEDGFDGTNNNWFFFSTSEARATDYSFVDELFNTNHRVETRKLIWRDENSSINEYGTSYYPAHNLGFIESTDTPPDKTVDSYIGSKSSKLQVNLKYRTGDVAENTNSSMNYFVGRIKVTEVLDLNSTPAWYQIIEKLNTFDETEGGALPSTLEAAAPYTPLVTTSFNKNLDTSVNNLQSLADAVDDMDLGVTRNITAISPTTADVTATINTLHRTDISGLTAERNFKIPAGAVGDFVMIHITTGDDLYEFIIKGDTGITINSGSTATEWSRLFITGEVVKLIATSTTNWDVVYDGRIPCKCVFERTSSNANTTHSAATDTKADWNSLAVDIGNMGDLTNDRANVRRAGYYIAAGGYAAAAGMADGKYGNLIVYKNGTTRIQAAALRQSTAGGGASSIFGAGLSSKPYLYALNDYIEYWFKTEDANMGLLATDYAGAGSAVLQAITHFSVTEILR